MNQSDPPIPPGDTSSVSEAEAASLATILVVDDEAELCRALSKLLTRNGYHVVTAS